MSDEKTFNLISFIFAMIGFIAIIHWLITGNVFISQTINEQKIEIEEVNNIE